MEENLSQTEDFVEGSHWIWPVDFDETKLA